MKFVAATFLLLGLMGCTHSLHVAHVSDFGPTYQSYEKGKLIKAYQEQFVVMGFADNTNYVDQAYLELQKKCPGGDIQGVTSQFSTSHGFFSWTNKIAMQGICL